MLVELDNHGNISGSRCGDLAGIAFARLRIKVDDGFGPAAACGCTHFEQALYQEVGLHLGLEVLRFVQRGLCQPVKLGYLHFEGLFHFLCSRRQKLQCSHTPSSNVCQAVEGGQFPCSDTVDFRPFVEHLVAQWSSSESAMKEGSPPKSFSLSPYTGNPFLTETLWMEARKGAMSYPLTRKSRSK